MANESLAMTYRCEFSKWMWILNLALAYSVALEIVLLDGPASLFWIENVTFCCDKYLSLKYLKYVSNFSEIFPLRASLNC